MTHDLDLAPIGNCSVSALLDRQGRFVWACAPRVDSDPLFSNLLSGVAATDPNARGVWAIDVENAATTTQSYLRNTPILRTEIVDKDGGAVEIIDFCPRYPQWGRVYRPIAFLRRVRALRGSPRITVRLKPAADWGGRDAPTTSGSNHIRYSCAELVLRLTTNCPASHILNQRTFRLEKPLGFFFGPDEPLNADVLSTIDRMLSETDSYWREWVRTLATPLDWQDVVIRAAITLKLCAYEETGAIVAALTTSIPEAPNSGRNWDYRYCWVRDAYYVVQALNRLGATDILENYLGYLRNLVHSANGGHIQPVYGVGYEPALTERMIETLPGYLGMGPVRAGNQAYEHYQHDVYGQIILSNTQAFFDQRLLRPATISDFEALEKVGDRAYALHDQPDASLWEFRGRAAIHTYSAIMCWAACDRLENAARALGLMDRAEHWRERAAEVRAKIESSAWNEKIGRYAASFGGDEIDASLLQLVDLRFLPPDDPRYLATLAAIEKELKHGDFLWRYNRPDDFGDPETAFNVCTFWFIEALHLAGRGEEARKLFDSMLSRRTQAGLLSEDISLTDGRLWGNYPQTYSLVGLINCAVLLSRPWSAVR
ncbi:glycoside hydrolase family 15 protein [Terrarubrum flagellatum]|uniref:glycoside hydrolase family 15 protein n=1 Tax=Terrirubrum flagellatum TaxID=2895980 RepID=UPI003144E38F